jgi:transposase
MNHIAIDLGGSESQICVRGPDGSIVEEKRHPTARLGGWLKRQVPARVILETSAEAFGIADLALEHGHEVRVVPATLVRSLGVGARGIKTDVRDARATSEASCRIDLPSVHVPSTRARELKSMCASREAQIGTRTKLINSVRGWMRRHVIRIRTGSAPTFAARVRAKLPAMPDGMPEHIERSLRAIEMLSELICEADAELRAIAAEDPICQRLMSVPGVGPVTAVRFMAALDEIKRFDSAHSVESYLGLTPGTWQSSERGYSTRITKAGSKQVRWALVQAAWCAMRARTRQNDPMVLWANAVAHRRGRKIAVTALARKIAGILFALWRDGTLYDPSRGADARPQLSH